MTAARPMPWTKKIHNELETLCGI